MRIVKPARIACIGPGQTACSDALYAFGVALGKAIATHNRVIICGGLGGFMEAVCRGAKQSPDTFPGQTIGILPGENPSDANPYVDIPVPTGMGIARNIIIVRTADIIIAAGGGAGTLSELAFAWQLKKRVLCVTGYGGWAEHLAGKAVDDRPGAAFISVGNIDEIRQNLG